MRLSIKPLTLVLSWRELGQDLDGDYFLHFSDEVNTCEITDLVMWMGLKMSTKGGLLSGCEVTCLNQSSQHVTDGADIVTGNTMK